MAEIIIMMMMVLMIMVMKMDLILAQFSTLNDPLYLLFRCGRVLKRHWLVLVLVRISTMFKNIHLCQSHIHTEIGVVATRCKSYLLQQISF